MSTAETVDDTNGAICHIAGSDATTATSMVANGHYIIWLPNGTWSSSADMTISAWADFDLVEDKYDIIYSPQQSVEILIKQFDDNLTQAVTWFQPKEAADGTYAGVRRYSAKDHIQGYSLSGTWSTRANFKACLGTSNPVILTGASSLAISAAALSLGVASLSWM